MFLQIINDAQMMLIYAFLAAGIEIMLLRPTGYGMGKPWDW